MIDDDRVAALRNIRRSRAERFDRTARGYFVQLHGTRAPKVVVVILLTQDL